MLVTCKLGCEELEEVVERDQATKNANIFSRHMIDFCVHGHICMYMHMYISACMYIHVHVVILGLSC